MKSKLMEIGAMVLVLLFFVNCPSSKNNNNRNALLALFFLSQQQGFQATVNLIGRVTTPTSTVPAGVSTASTGDGAALPLANNCVANTTCPAGFLTATTNAGAAATSTITNAGNLALVRLENPQGAQTLFSDANTPNVDFTEAGTTAAATGVFNLTFRVNQPTATLNGFVNTLNSGVNCIPDGLTTTNPCDVQTNYRNTSAIPNGSIANPNGTGNVGLSIPAGSFTVNLNVDSTNPSASTLTLSSANGVVVRVISVVVTVRGVYNNPNATVGENLCDGVGLSGNPITVSSNITSNTTWTTGSIYQLNGVINVQSNATLTIQPGVLIAGNRGSAIFVQRGAKLLSNGTATQPVCFTSSQPLGSRFPGDWGGIVVVGNGNATRNSQTEGTTPANYGNGGTVNNTADDQFRATYTINEFAGFEVAPGDELNSFSFYAVNGNNTSLQNVQAHRGLDDSFEWWGGTIGGNRLIVTGGQDDDFDADEGFASNGSFNTAGSPTLQYLISHKYPVACGGSPSTDPHSFEIDGVNSGSGLTGNPVGQFALNGVGMSNPYIRNWVAIGQGIAGGELMRLREGFQGTIADGVGTGFVGTTQGSVANTVITSLNNAGFPNTTATVTNVAYDNLGFAAASTSSTINGTAGTGSGAGAGIAGSVSVSTIGTPANVVENQGTIGGTGTGCGFGTKPNYTATAPYNAAGQGAIFNNASFGGQAIGNWAQGWTVYRAR